MERKLIKQGGGGYTIYLPKKWIDKKKLKAGDIIKISESDESLVIGSEVKEKKDIILEINEENKHNLRSLLTHSYRKGFNKIELKNITPELIKEVKKITSDVLLGFELTGIEKNSCFLENISEPTDNKYEVILKKVFMIIKEMQNLDIESKEIKENEELRNQLDKFILFCRRMLIKEKYEKNITLEWELLTFLTHIGHSYYYLYEYTQENKVKLTKKNLDLLESLKEYFSLFEDSYYNNNIDSINKINKLKTKYQFGECLKLLEKSKGKETVALSYIREIFRIIQIGTSPILSKILEKESLK
jgi:hypothetical protein